MKKNTLKAFTLVEMLIVIVIIGILIAALLPRMSAAQGRARDVSRKTALSQVQSAIVSYQGDVGHWPKEDEANTNGIPVSDIGQDLLNAGMSSVPSDPLQTSSFEGLDATISDGQYGYLVTKRNGAEKAGFVLMARTEMAGGSNWVHCSGDTSTHFTGGTDLKERSLCTSVAKAGDGEPCTVSGGVCKYTSDDQLRYVVFF